jgi:omega-amidase
MSNVVRVALSGGCSWVSRGAVPPVLKGADVLVFPELVDGGYAALARGEGRHTFGDALHRSFAALTSTGVPVCIAGSVLLKARGGDATNTCLVYRRGHCIHRYDKIHLFRAGGDTRYFSPGRTLGTFSLPAGRHRLRAGVVLCYDLRFPELIRAMARQGMRVLFVPARWPMVRDLAWRTLLRARAIENQIFVVGCNGPGREGGHSYVFGPLGEELFSSKGKGRQMIWKVDLPLRRLEESRRLHSNLRDAVLLRSTAIPALLPKAR